jgi:hypothetical protein
MKHNIELIAWSTSCGEEGCCNDYGTRLIVNNEIVAHDFGYDEDLIADFLKALGITEFEITREGAE